jgi:hypothetical protein
MINGGTFSRKNNIIPPHYWKHEGNPLTICIAAICQESETDPRQCVVFATDHMVTIDIGERSERVLGKFEHSIKKHKVISPLCVVLIAGDPVLLKELTVDTSETMGYTEIKNKIFENFKKVRDNIIQNEILNAFGIDKNILGNLLASEELNDTASAILEAVMGFSLNTEIMLIGFNENGDAEISEINEDGISDVTDLHFSAIGSGYIQAINTLYFQKHTNDRNLNTAVYNVFKAKSNAEVHEGVGRETDLLILKPGHCIQLTKTQLDLLRDIYDKELDFGAKHNDLKRLKLDTGA